MSWREFYYRWEWELGGTPDQLWPYVSDTNRFNADVGLGHLVINERLPDQLGRRLRFNQFGLVPIEWIEEPFDWVYAKSFGVLRTYTLGPVAQMRVFTTLERIGANRTRLVYEVWATPRHLLGLIAIPVVIGVKSKQDFGRVFNMYSDWVVNGADPVDQGIKRPKLGPQSRNRVEAIRQQLLNQGIEPILLNQLLQLIATGQPHDLNQMRPYALAEQWLAPTSEVLELFLYSTKAGLLDLEWQLLCPGCRGAGDNVTDDLKDISTSAHCDSCLIDYDVNFEHGVELVFRPNPAIRPIDVMNFCVGGPQITPHIVAQQILSPGETRLIDMELMDGRHRIRRVNEGSVHFIKVDPVGERSLNLDTLDGAERLIAPSVQIQLGNRLEQPEQVIIERTRWSDSAVTAAEVIANQAFRDLFSSQALRPDAQFSVGQTTIVFTDLVGSTQMYNEIGDAPAFGLVLNHFDVLKEAIAEHNGAIIKTIGDAVMAGFREPAHAIEAIMVAQERLQAMDADRDLLLKASVHTGGCIAVTLNERLDYFGSTVNIAARLEGFARPNVTVVSEPVMSDPGVQQFLNQDRKRVGIERFEGMLKGFGERPFQLFRLENRRVKRVEPDPGAGKGPKVAEIRVT